MVSLDEPKGIAETGGYATGGMVSAPSVKAIIENIVSLYGILPGDWSSKTAARDRLDADRRAGRAAAAFMPASGARPAAGAQGAAGARRRTGSGRTGSASRCG